MTDKKILEKIKKEWMLCARFIRKTYTLKYPRYFDETIEKEIDKHFKNESE